MIYVVQLGRWPIVKVGFSDNVDVRLTSLQTCAPFPLQLLQVVEGTRQQETAAHHKLEVWRTNSEWYLLTPESLGALREIFPGLEVPAVDIEPSIAEAVAAARLKALREEHEWLVRRTSLAALELTRIQGLLDQLGDNEKER